MVESYVEIAKSTVEPYALPRSEQLIDFIYEAVEFHRSSHTSQSEMNNRI